MKWVLTERMPLGNFFGLAVWGRDRAAEENHVRSVSEPPGRCRHKVAAASIVASGARDAESFRSSTRESQEPTGGCEP
jgi:hypothetical protein